MKKWALLLILFAIPLAAQTVDSMQLKVDALGDSIQTLDHRMEKIEERWSDIKETADASGKWARWLTIGGIGLAALILAALILYGITSTRRVERDLREIEKMREQATSILDFLKGAVDETVNAMERTRKERERSKDEGKDVGELDRKLTELSQRLDIFQRMGLPLDAEGWYETGKEFHRGGNFKDALEVYDKAIELNPEFAEAINSKGCAFASLDNHEQAIIDFNTAILLKPDWHIPYYNLGASQYELDEYIYARQNLEEAIELSHGRESLYFVELAKTLMKLNKPDDTLEVLRKAKTMKRFGSMKYLWQMEVFKSLQKSPYLERFRKIVDEKPKSSKAKRK